MKRWLSGLALLGSIAVGLAGEVSGPKVLLVVAHPDDEYYFAGTAYRIAQELNGAVDQVIITNGEGGFRYSTLAERIYGIHLTDEATGRSRLPEIRRQEVLAAGRILGIRQHYFFNELDQKFTLDAGEALGKIWNCGSVRAKLRDIFTRNHYDFVFTLLPRASTHGHHQAATLLTLEIVRDMPAADRPVVLGAEPGTAQHIDNYTALAGFPLSSTISAEPAVAFNRLQKFGYQDALHYEIVVQWVIAEHKSQGMFQNDAGKHDVEYFWRFATGPEDAALRTRNLARLLRRQPEEESERPGRMCPSCAPKERQVAQQ